jgi:hypothetical protein
MRAFLAWLLFFQIYRCFVIFFAGWGKFRVEEGIYGVLGDIAAATLLSGLMQLTHGLRNNAGRWLLRCCGALLALFLVSTFGFARLYQRGFTFGYIRTDSLSIWKENFASAIYEFGPAHFVVLILIGGAILAAHKFAQRVPRRQAVIFCLTGLITLPALIFFQPTPAGVVSNPLVAAFGPKQKAAAMHAALPAADDLIPSTDAPELAPFLRGVETPDLRGYNVILYFLESTPYTVIDQKIQGKELTPNLNALKRRSISLKRHYANFPLSINAFYNAFCSAYALPDGAWISLVQPDFPVPCLSQSLARKGYRNIGLHAGYLGYAKQKRFMQKRDFAQLIDAEKIKKSPYEKGMGPWGAADERSMIRPLKEFAAADSKNPFLAVLFSFTPHHPYDMPEGFPELITTDADLKKQQRRYYNSLHFSDKAFGDILAAIEAGGILDKTILIAVGDHGEAFYEHRGNYNHPFYIYEENVHVPLFIYYKGVKPVEIERVTSHVDILPTVLSMLRVPELKSPLHVGQSMLRSGPQSVAHLQAYWQEEYSGIVDQRYKFIRKDSGELELYDLQRDPAEKQNLAEAETFLSKTYRLLAERAFLQKKAYYKKYGNYELVRFNPASQDK